MSVKPDWWKNPPKSIESTLFIFNERIEHLNDDSAEGRTLRKLHERIERAAEELTSKARKLNPIGFAKLGWEQALKCNAWVWGVGFIIDFDANRKGKTAGSIFDALLWMLPNHPNWLMFQEYTDDWDRLVRILQRPSANSVLEIRSFLKSNPHLKGNMLEQPYDIASGNAEKFATLQKYLPHCFQACYPIPPFSEQEHTIWHGAPDSDYHKAIIMPEWRKWLPTAIMERDSDYDKTFDLRISYMDGESEGETNWKIICKSYESADTKWSGAAVTGVLLTEGLKEPTLNEIKQRFRNDAFGYWDYTPYEARNVGAKTALAHRVFKGKVELPLSPFVYSGFGIEKTPEFILPAEKKADQLRMWMGKPEGEARIHGKFYTSSPVVLTHLDKDFHTLPWTKEELFQKFPSGNLYRGLDPGFDHPTACAWGLLSPQNVWYIYRFYSEAGTSIPQRCENIVKLSGNDRHKIFYGRSEIDFYYQEMHPDHKSEVIISTFCDYHTFKTDENTKQPYSSNYIKQGLIVTASTTIGPRERSQIFDQALAPDLSKPHPILKRPPGCRVYFLINEPGVAEAFEKLENIFWDRYRTGDKLGEPKDQIQEHEDDEFDAGSYLVCSPNRWTSTRGNRIEPKEQSFATLQRSSSPQRRQNFAMTGR